MYVDTLPSLAREYWHALAHSKPGLAHDEAIPRARLEVGKLRVDPQALARYRSFVGSGENFPLAYAYVLAQPAHFHLINQPDFPVRCVGLVHASNHTRRLGEIDPSQPLALSVAVTEDHPRRRGREFMLHTVLSQNGRDLIEMDSACFTRVRGAPRGESSRPAEAPPVQVEAGERLVDLRFAAHFGRRYARVSGDYNPIHLAAWLARPFGFRRAIAHGVGSMARIEAELARNSGTATREMAIRFRRPLELPGQTVLHRCAQDPAGYVLLDANGRELLSGVRR
ncbi:MAG: MaoC/PaaZ C-terminal domain-containing protein [Lysobacterales bacterium]|nr:hypothetical protein [Xanthomonadales bacterium]